MTQRAYFTKKTKLEGQIDKIISWGDKLIKQAKLKGEIDKKCKFGEPNCDICHFPKSVETAAMITQGKMLGIF